MPWSPKYSTFCTLVNVLDGIWESNYIYISIYSAKRLNRLEQNPHKQAGDWWTPGVHWPISLPWDFQANERPCVKKQSGCWLRNDSWGNPLTPTHANMYACTLAHSRAPTHTWTCTYTQKDTKTSVKFKWILPRMGGDELEGLRFLSRVNSGRTKNYSPHHISTCLLPHLGSVFTTSGKKLSASRSRVLWRGK